MGFVFVGFSRIILLGILIFQGLTARRLYKSFGVKVLNEELFLPHRQISHFHLVLKSMKLFAI
jgi:hypothetical protein